MAYNQNGDSLQVHACAASWQFVTVTAERERERERAM